MKYEYNLSSVAEIEAGLLYFIDGTEKRFIDLRKSADIWWDHYHRRPSFADWLLRRKAKNIYAGGKNFCTDKPYIRFYDGEDEFVFSEALPKNASEEERRRFRERWESINIALNKQGFWLFDEG